MAITGRADFGGTSSDYTADNVGGVVRIKSGTLEFYDQRAGGTRYADLLHDGQAVTTIAVPKSGQIPVFQGPPGVVIMWAEDGLESTERVAIVAIVSATEQAAASVEAAWDIVHAASPISFDTDGTPYINDTAGTPGSAIAFDIDGTPYLIGA